MKAPGLLDNPVTGYARLHPELRAMLQYVCGVCEQLGYHRPLVTCFGRTRDEMEQIYLPTYLQDGHPESVARDLARGRFSWHCVPIDERGELGFFRAFDLRDHGKDWEYSDRDCVTIAEAVRERYVHVKLELLDHAVAGNARHFHFAYPDPAGKPADWR